MVQNGFGFENKIYLKILFSRTSRLRMLEIWCVALASGPLFNGGPGSKMALP